LSYLDRLQPTGQANPEAVFISRGLDVVNAYCVGSEKQHLRLKVRAGMVTFDAIAFRQGYCAENMPPQIDLLYSIELNEYNGRTSLQLNVRDLKPAGLSD
jgi:single-stranded-DNA-specific exonuclease